MWPGSWDLKILDPAVAICNCVRWDIFVKVFDTVNACGRNYSSHVRTKEQIEAAGAYDRDQFVPPPLTKFSQWAPLSISSLVICQLFCQTCLLAQWVLWTAFRSLASENKIKNLSYCRRAMQHIMPCNILSADTQLCKNLHLKRLAIAEWQWESLRVIRTGIIGSMLKV